MYTYVCVYVCVCFDIYGQDMGIWRFPGCYPVSKPMTPVYREEFL